MTFKTWRSKNRTLEQLALKLCEEAGEVAKEINDASVRGRKPRKNALVELDHVDEISRILRARLEGRKP